MVRSFYLKINSELQIFSRLGCIFYNNFINLRDAPATGGTSRGKFLNFRSCEGACTQRLFYLVLRDMTTETDQSFLIHWNKIIK